MTKTLFCKIKLHMIKLNIGNTNQCQDWKSSLSRSIYIDQMVYFLQYPQMTLSETYTINQVMYQWSQSIFEVIFEVIFVNSSSFTRFFIILNNRLVFILPVSFSLFLYERETDIFTKLWHVISTLSL